MTLLEETAEGIGLLGAQYSGRNGRGEENLNFIPRSKLQNYLPAERIHEILRVSGNLVSLKRAEYIAEHYLQVFALLVYIGHVGHLDRLTQNNFYDHFFPLEPEELPPSWPTGGLFEEFTDKALKSQWMFFPVTFDPDSLYNPTIGPRHILPIYKEDIIARGNAVTVSKIMVHKECTAPNQV